MGEEAENVASRAVGEGVVVERVDGISVAAGEGLVLVGLIDLFERRT